MTLKYIGTMNKRFVSGSTVVGLNNWWCSRHLRGSANSGTTSRLMERFMEQSICQIVECREAKIAVPCGREAADKKEINLRGSQVLRQRIEHFEKPIIRSQ
jgi:hypothetical protein